MGFEAAYYEDPAFWDNGMVEDAGNLLRIERTIAIVPNGIGTLVDVGCGNGVFARMLKSRRPQIHVTGVDRSATALKHVMADAKFNSETTELPFADRSFDCVTCLQVLEHLSCPDYQVALAELARIARNTIVIGVPFDEPVLKYMDTCPQCRTVFNRNLHFRTYDEGAFRGMLNEHGFRIAEFEFPVKTSHYVGFPSYYKIRRFLSGEGDGRERFLSPLCPLCGYRPERTELATAAAPLPRAFGEAKVSGPKAFVKRLWPKQTTKGYWVLGRFERV